MNQLYRNFIVGLAFCFTGTFAFATGHTVSISHTNAWCFNSCTGTATATVSGGTGPFSYSWAPNGGTAATANALCAGSYTVTVTDNADMSTATATVQIIQPPAITLSATSTPALCNGGMGSATVTVTGGTPPYTYSWSPSGGTSPFLNNAPVGTYTCICTDGNGCTGITTVVITQPPPLVLANLTATPSTICAGQSSQLNSTISGGTGSYSFSWSPVATLNSTNVPSPLASPSVTTTYSLIGTDANGCVAGATVQVVVNSGITANITSTDPTCNQSNGALTINVTQAAPPYSLLWSNSQTTATINNLPAGVYSCDVTDANGCTGNFSSGLSNIGGPTLNTSITNTGCSNYSNGTATANVSGLPPFTYSWNTTPVQTTATATGLGTGTYMVTVTDSAGCVSVAPAQVNATGGNLFMYAYWTSVGVCNQATGAANSMVQGGTPPYSYMWLPGNSTAPNLTSVASGTYTLTATDANGCTTTGATTIPSNCASYIQGRVYLDMNQDSVFDAGDLPLNGQIVNATSAVNGVMSTNINGYYGMFLTCNGAVDVSITSPMYYSFEVPQSGHNYITIPAMGDSVLNVDFALYAPSPFQDLYCSLASGPARPGFLQYYNIHCENRGTTTVSDTIWFVHDSLLTVNSVYPAFDGYTHPVGYWTFNNFAPGQVINKTIYLQVPTIANGGYVGRHLFASARIEPTASDTSSPDNGDDEVDIIVASCDPNLKESWSPTMNSTGDIWPGDITLDYTIHFQNSGNDTAFTVVVVDTLPAQLDISTFRMGASSHPCTYSVSGRNDTNIVTFTFMNILLPDSNINEPASHGFVQFTIDRDPNLPNGTTIENQASNYFDFNLPVPTNINIVTVSDPLNVIPASENNNVIVYPNPAFEMINVLIGPGLPGAGTTLTLTDVSGRVVLTENTGENTYVPLSTTGIAAGVYFLTVKAENGMSVTEQLIISEK